MLRKNNNLNNPTLKLDPYFITGLTESEGSFSVYKHDKNSLQITLIGFKLWQNVIFKHFSLYTLYGSKTLRLNKLLTIRELLIDNKHLMQVGIYRKWKPDYKLLV